MGVPTEKIQRRLEDIEEAVMYLETSANTYVLTDNQLDYMNALAARIQAEVSLIRRKRKARM